MDWLHCNTCFYQTEEIERRRLFLTSCGHLYCSSCLQIEKSSGLGTCSVCKRQFSIVPINSEMEEELKTYFSDPGNTLKTVMKIVRFQNEHRLKLIEHYGRTRSSYRKYKEFYEMALKEKNCLQARLRQLEEENKSLKGNTTPFFFKGDSGQYVNSKPEQSFNFCPSQNIPLSKPLTPFMVNPTRSQQVTPTHKIWTDRITLSSLSKKPFGTST